MAKDSSFDLVSKVELPEVTNAIHTALKEIQIDVTLKEVKVILNLKKKYLF